MGSELPSIHSHLGRTIRSTTLALINTRDFRHQFEAFQPAGSCIKSYGEDGTHSDGDGDAEESKPLKVRSLDLCIETNTDDHHTENYMTTEPHQFDGEARCAQLIVRRGQPFTIKLQFTARSYNENTDAIRLIFSISPEPKQSKGTLVRLRATKELKPRQWGAAVSETNPDEKTVCIQVMPACDAIIGKWSLRVDTFCVDESGQIVYPEGQEQALVLQYHHPEQIYLLFNPWCREDVVYMDDDDLRDEYIMNDQGKIYKGMAIRVTAIPWNYAQFEETILDCCLYLLDKCNLEYSVRDNPVKIVRCLSAIVNSPDGDCVLAGNWSGQYKDGTPPSAWTSSNDILDQYWQTKSTVKYGQCFVFSAVTTTVCRCLGIPARSVTNYKSAHDTDGSVSLDYHYDSAMNPITSYNTDTVWNYHVWNEAWMARQDLPSPDYGGWQAFDATPQETSTGVSQAGPASVLAIKRGEIQLPYDAGFIYAEVYAERFNWYHQEDDDLEWRTEINTKPIGVMISTKMPRRQLLKTDVKHSRCDVNIDRLDLTDTYKFREGTEERRAAQMRSHQSSKYAAMFNIYETPIQDVKVAISHTDQIVYGRDFEITIECVNACRERRTIVGSVHVSTTYQTGVPKAKIVVEEFQIFMYKAGRKCFTVPVDLVNFAPGEKDLVDNPSFSVSMSGLILETQQPVSDQEEFIPVVPDVEITGPHKVNIDKLFTLKFTFENPLSTILTNCSWKIHASNITGKAQTVEHTDVGPNAVVTYSISLTAHKRRNRFPDRQINVTFSSNQLQNVSGHHIVTLET